MSCGLTVILRKHHKGLSLQSSLGPQREPLRFAQLLTRTHSPSTCRPLVHSVSPKQSVPGLALRIYSSSQDAHRASRLAGSLSGSAFAFTEDASVNQDSTDWRLAGSDPGRRYILPTKCPSIEGCGKFYHLFSPVFKNSL